MPDDFKEGESQESYEAKCERIFKLLGVDMSNCKSMLNFQAAVDKVTETVASIPATVKQSGNFAKALYEASKGYLEGLHKDIVNLLYQYSNCSPSDENGRAIILERL